MNKIIITLLILGLVSLCAIINASAAVIRVPEDYTTIQEAIDAASEGDTILVGPGTYYEEEIDIDKNLVLRSKDGPEVTTIQASAVVVNFSGSINPSTVVEGFTIANSGNANYGFYCFGTSPTIKNNIITQCSAGGIYCKNTNSMRIEGNIITSTTQGYGITVRSGNQDLVITGNEISSCIGGGIRVEDSLVEISDNLIKDNTYTPLRPGNGIFCYNIDSSSIISNNIIVNNNANQLGGGIFCDGAAPLIKNNLIINNTAGHLEIPITEGYGGGIYCANVNSVISILNNTIAGNTCLGSFWPEGGGIYIVDSDEVTITDCIVTDNEAMFASGIRVNNTYPANLTYSCVRDDIAGVYLGDGCITENPLFTSTFGSYGDYYLSHIFTGQPQNSPCVDAGSDTAQNLGLDSRTTRIDGIGDMGTVDMGYHYAPAKLKLTVFIQGFFRSNTHSQVVTPVTVQLRHPTNPSIVIATYDVALDDQGSAEIEVWPGSYRVSVNHYNHLAVMTSTPVIFFNGETRKVNFSNTNCSDYVLAEGIEPMWDEGDGFYSMRAGDANDDGVVNASGDFIIWRDANGTVPGVPGWDERADFNGDEVVNACGDFVLWRLNNGRESWVPGKGKADRRSFESQNKSEEKL